MLQAGLWIGLSRRASKPKAILARPRCPTGQLGVPFTQTSLAVLDDDIGHTVSDNPNTRTAKDHHDHRAFCTTQSCKLYHGGRVMGVFVASFVARLPKRDSRLHQAVGASDLKDLVRRAGIEPARTLRPKGF